MTTSVPCHDAGRTDVSAVRFVPTRFGNVPMCDSCWNGGMGPGLQWEPKGKPHEQDVKPHSITLKGPASATTALSHGRKLTEPRINPDPDGTLKDAIEYLDKFIRANRGRA
jgi:hypothetical protein